MLIEKVQKNEHTKADAKKVQDLNSHRSRLVNAISEELGGQEDIKV